MILLFTYIPYRSILNTYIKSLIYSRRSV